MDQILENKWLLIGVVGTALALAIGIVVYRMFRRNTEESTKEVSQQMGETLQQPFAGESEDALATQGEEQQRPSEDEEQQEESVPA